MFARIKARIQSIRYGTYVVRRNWMWGVSLTIFIVVVLAWIFFFHYAGDGGGQEAASPGNSFSELWKHIGDQFSTTVNMVNHGLDTIQSASSTVGTSTVLAPFITSAASSTASQEMAPVVSTSTAQ